MLSRTGIVYFSITELFLMPFWKSSHSRCAFTWHEKYLTTFPTPIYDSEFLFYGMVKNPLHKYFFSFYVSLFFVNKSHKNSTFVDWASRVLQCSTADTKLSAKAKNVSGLAIFIHLTILACILRGLFYPIHRSCCTFQHVVSMRNASQTKFYSRQLDVCCVVMGNCFVCKVLFFLFDL